MRIRRLEILEINTHPENFRSIQTFPNQRRRQFTILDNDSSLTFITEIGERAFANYFLEIITGSKYILSHPESVGDFILP